MSWTQIGPKASNPITLALAKAQCRVTNSAEDALFVLYIESALEYCETYLGRILIGTTYQANLTVTGNAVAFSGFGPVNVLEVLLDGQVTPLDDDLYSVEYTAGSMIICSDSFADGEEVSITIRAGLEPVPQSLQEVMLLLIGDSYEHRTAGITGTIHTDNPAVKSKLTPHRVWSL